MAINRSNGGSGNGHRGGNCGMIMVVMAVMTPEIQVDQKHRPNWQRDSLPSGFWVLTSEYRAWVGHIMSS